MPDELRLELDNEAIRDHVNRLAVPLLRLNPLCVREPWWLIFIAHEVGHHAQYAILPQREMVTEFAHRVGNQVASNLGQGVSTWRNWGEEIFADLFAAAAVGPWSLWALTEFERGPANHMVQPRRRYPQPIVRLALVSHACVKLGLAKDLDSLAPYLRGVDPWSFANTSTEVKTDLDTAKRVADTITEALPKVGFSIASLCDASTHEVRVAEWQSELTMDNPKASVTKEDWAARMAIVAGCSSWSKIGGDAPRAKVLADELIALLQGCSPPGDRAGAEDLRPEQPGGFGDALLRVAREQRR